MNIRTMVQYNLFAAAFSGYLNDAQARAMRCMVFSKQGEFGDVINQAIRSHQSVRPIHLAACVGANKFIEELLKLAANPNNELRYGCGYYATYTKPLHMALVHSIQQSARILSMIAPSRRPIETVRMATRTSR